MFDELGGTCFTAAFRPFSKEDPMRLPYGTTNPAKLKHVRELPD